MRSQPGSCCPISHRPETPGPGPLPHPLPPSPSSGGREGGGGRQAGGEGEVFYALVLLTLVHLLNHLDQRTLAAIFPLIQAEWNLSDAQLGLVATGHALARALAALPAGWLADRYGRVWVLRLASAAWGTLATLSGLAGQFWQFLLARTGTGLADGANGPADVAFLSDLFPEERRGQALSLYSLGMYAGSALGFVIGGIVGERWGWRWAFVAPGLLGCLCAIFIGRLREPRRVERAWSDDSIVSIRLAEVLHAVMSPPLLAGLLGGSLGLFATTALTSWTPTFIHRYHGRSVSQAGLTTSLILFPASVLGVLLGGVLSDRLLARIPTARFLTAALGLWVGIPFGLLAVLAPVWTLYLVGAFPAALFLSSHLAPLLALVQEAVEPRWRATAMALALLITQVAGGATAGMAVGALSDAVGLRMAMLLPLGAALLGGLMLLLGARRHTVPN